MVKIEKQSDGTFTVTGLTTEDLLTTAACFSDVTLNLSLAMRNPDLSSDERLAIMSVVERVLSSMPFAQAAARAGVAERQDAVVKATTANLDAELNDLLG